jgi:hypothetical protein
MDESGVFPCQCHFSMALHTYISPGSEQWAVGGHSSERMSHPIDMNNYNNNNNNKKHDLS